MNRKEFIKNMVASVSVAAIHSFAFANEGEKKMKCAVIYFSWSGNTRFAAETVAKKGLFPVIRESRLEPLADVG